ncbi:hypothetical protein, partial [Dokdonella sp.]|uniref:hypothetical protein n=1 Tax=Dokdonella sp. TaxID=2291710 RepID=UPI0025C0E7E4
LPLRRSTISNTPRYSAFLERQFAPTHRELAMNAGITLPQLRPGKVRAAASGRTEPAGNKQIAIKRKGTPVAMPSAALNAALRLAYQPTPKSANRHGCCG